MFRCSRFSVCMAVVGDGGGGRGDGEQVLHHYNTARKQPRLHGAYVILISKMCSLFLEDHSPKRILTFSALSKRYCFLHETKQCIQRLRKRNNKNKENLLLQAELFHSQCGEEVV